MSDALKSVLLVCDLPMRWDLCGVKVFINRSSMDKRNNMTMTDQQLVIWMCRMLIFSEEQIFTSPSPAYLRSHIDIVTYKSFLMSGKLREILQKHDCFDLGWQHIEVTDAVFQSCLSYSLVARLAPRWNQVGNSYLVQGRDFLKATEPIPAMNYKLQVQGNDLIIHLTPLRLRLPPLEVSDLEISREIFEDFIYSRIPAITSAMMGCGMMNTLPSLRAGRIDSISHNIPSSCPMRSYQEIVKYWKNMYGYRLPKPIPGKPYSPAGPYISIIYHQFGPFPNAVYTYPALCVRKKVPNNILSVDHAPLVKDFGLEVNLRLTQLCGMPFKTTFRLGRPQPDLGVAVYQVLITPEQRRQQLANFTPIPLSSLPKGRSVLKTSLGHPRSLLASVTPQQPSQVPEATITSSSTPQQFSYAPTITSSILKFAVKQNQVEEAEAVVKTGSQEGDATLPTIPANLLKWYPKSISNHQQQQQGQQSATEVPKGPLRVPLFGKKAILLKKVTKTLIIPVKKVSNDSSLQVLLNAAPSTVPCSAPTLQTEPLTPPPTAGESPSTLNSPRTKTVPNILKKRPASSPISSCNSPGVAEQASATPSPATPSPTSSTPAKTRKKSPRNEKTEKEVEFLINSGHAEAASVPQLLRWLHKRQVPCMSRDRKADLLTKVDDYFSKPW